MGSYDDSLFEVDAGFNSDTGGHSNDVRARVSGSVVSGSFRDRLLANMTHIVERITLVLHCLTRSMTCANARDTDSIPNITSSSYDRGASRMLAFVMTTAERCFPELDVRHSSWTLFAAEKTRDLKLLHG